jgi:hypothetical protein
METEGYDNTAHVTARQRTTSYPYWLNARAQLAYLNSGLGVDFSLRYPGAEESPPASLDGIYKVFRQGTIF